MSLFTINRYEGEDSISQDLQKNQMAKILEKLNKSASKSKKGKVIKGKVKRKSTGQTSTLDSPLQSPEKKRRKSGLSKSEASPLPQPETDDQEERSKKKKKRKRGLSETEDSKPEAIDTTTTPVAPEKSKNTTKKRDASSTKQLKREKAEKQEPDVSKIAAKSVVGDDKKESRTLEKIVSKSDSDESASDELTNDKSDSDKEDSDQELEADGPGFAVLGQVKETHLSKLSYKLPTWLSHPHVMRSDLRQGGLPLAQAKFLDDIMLETLNEDGVERLFPVQQHLVPAILNSCKPNFSSGLYGFRPRDICCSSPTGSGKTLAYVLPIVQALKSRLVPGIRAIVVLPVRDLAKQVYQVFTKLCRKTELKIGLIVGMKSLAQEQASLVREDSDGTCHCLVDVVVATPGRLVDHLQKTKGFDLSRLRFIVIDEADRVMDEIKQDWLHQVTEIVNGCHGNNIFSQPLTAASIGRLKVIPPQKLLFSATLTQNPEKLQMLKLFQPELFTSLVTKDETKVEMRTEGDFIGKYSTPTGLTEYFTECTPQQRPLIVLHYLHNLKFNHVLCFTNSKESTHRLATLVQIFGDIQVREFSSKMDASKRAKIIKEFEAGRVQMIVCSDAMARGMDISNVKYIISYEPPPKIKTYIHRVGRTARAGRAGTAFSLLERKDVFSFKQMVKSSGKSDVMEQKVRASMFKNLVARYEEALRKVPVQLRNEKLKKSTQKR